VLCIGKHLTHSPNLVRKTTKIHEEPEKFQFHYPDKGHVFDQENQTIAWPWFNRWLKAGK